MVKKYREILPVLILLIVTSFVLIGVATFLNFDMTNFKKDALIIEGEINSIDRVEKWINDRKEYRYYVNVNYSVNGKEYNKDINSYSSSMYEGQKIKLYYHEDTPGDARYLDYSVIIYVLYILGGILLVMDAIIFIRYKNRLDKYDSDFNW